MKLTIQMADELLELFKREAARQNRTVSELVETALRLYLEQQKRGLQPLPTFSSELLVDIDNHEALYEVMDGDELRKMYRTSVP